MKNKKIIAILCVMTMLMTTLSSFFVVTAAPTPSLKATIEDTADEGVYLVTVSYDGFEENVSKIGTIGAEVIIPDNVTYVVGSAATDVGGAAIDYDADNKLVKFGFATVTESVYLRAASGVLATFKISGITSAGKLEFKDVSKITDYSEDALDGTEYTVKAGSLKAEPIDLPFVEPQGDRPAIKMVAEDNGDGTYTVKVSYDLTAANIASPKIGTIGVEIPVDKNVYVAGSAATDVGGAAIDYDADNQLVKFGFATVTESVYLKSNTADLFTFKVKVEDKLTLNVSVAKITDYSIDALDGDEFTGNKVYALPLKISAGGDVTTPTDTPKPTDPVESATPAPTATPKPVEIPEKVVTTVSVPNLGGEGSQALKAFNINLSDFDVKDAQALKNVKDVMIVMQGYNTDDGMKIPMGLVSIIVPASSLGKSGNVQGKIYGADTIAVNIFDANNTDNILASRVEVKVN